jgi:type I restriction enzyme S subunit
MSSGISSTPKQAGHGSPFLSFSAVFGNYFLPERFDDLMQTSDLEQKKYSVLEGDIFLTRTSETIGELGMSSVAVKNYPNATYSGFLKRLRPTQKDVTYHKFMGFYLRSKLFRKTMTNNAVLTLRASLNEDIFSYLSLIIPEYNDQVKIGDFLYLLNQKIDLNNRINSELEKMAKTLYDYWFVQFDFPNENGKPYKSSGGKMVWNQELKREIPEGWEVENLFSSKYTKLVPTGVDYFDGEKIYLSTSEVENSQIINHSIKTNYLNRKSRANMQPKPKTIWFARMKDTKKIILIDDYCDDLIENYIFSTGFAGIELKNNSLYFLWSYINSNDFEDIKNRYSTGTTQKSITNEGIEKIKILIPSQDLLNIFDSKVSNVYKKIYVNNQQNQALTELRDWLLPMLMNGQVKVE